MRHDGLGVSDHSDLGQSLRCRRKQAGLTLNELSERCGVSVSHLSEIERGITAPSIWSLGQIANVYGLELFIGFRRKESTP